ncbi:MAG: response regulator [Verrucomicrobiae bacterium]|nr:response regulator [Verrucomicrobiae bacterium]
MNSDCGVEFEILAIEDSESDLALLRAYLVETPDFQSNLTSCSTLEDAIRLLAAVRFSIILLDLELPDSSQEEGLRRLRSLTRTPIVVISGHEDEKLAGRIVHLGAQDCFPKRFLNGPLLRRAIRHGIERKYLLDRITRLSTTITRLDKLDSIGSIATGLAHELRHPLTSLTLAIDYFQDQDFDEDTQQRVRNMRSSLQRATTVVTSLLDFASEAPFAPEPVPVAVLIDETLALLDTDLRAHDIDYTTTIAPGLPSVCVDRARIEQILINLVRNAIQATLTCPEQPLIAIDVTHFEGYIQIAISDNGHGINDDDLKKIFEPFFSTKRRGEGTGLGLTVAKELAELHGGVLQLMPSPSGRGCRALLSLPVS